MTTVLRRLRTAIAHFAGCSTNELKYRRLFDEARDAIVVTHRDGAVIEANPAAIALLGYSGAEIVALNLRDLSVDPQEHDQVANRLAQGGEIRDVRTNLRCKDGAVVHVLITPTVRRDDDRDDVFVIRDVTATLALEQQMHHARKMEAIGRLAGGIAHDFNNLLTAITGYSELLISSFAPTDARIQDAFEIRRAALSAGRLTGQLLAFSRNQRSHTEIVDLNGLVARTAAVLKRALGEDIAVTLALDPAVKPVKADPGHLEQIVLNLAVNARDAMPSGGRLTMTTSMYRCRGELDGGTPAGEYVRLTVADTGCGIPEAIQSNVFEPFFTTKGTAGTGIGLATVYGIVKQNGGDIHFESTEGTGTTFTIDLPSTAQALPTRDATGERPHFVEGCATVLVVEDDPRVRELVELVLRRAGHDVVVAAGPREALTALSGQPDINLVLTDVVMPEMNGYDLAEEMRRIAPGLRVVFMSGFASDRFRRPVSEPFIAKPFSVESLTAAIELAVTSPAFDSRLAGLVDSRKQLTDREPSSARAPAMALPAAG